MLLALGTAALLAGCSEILPSAPETRLQFACAVLDPDVAGRVVVHAWVEEGVADADLGIGSAHAALERELEGIGLRRGEGDVAFERQRLAEPDEGWDAEALRAWAEDLPFDFGDEVHLHVLWVGTLGDGRATLLGPPAVTAVSGGAVLAGAGRMGVAPQDVARAELLHAAGHALGVVNLGIPMQDADPQGREQPAGHDPDPASVLNAGWDRATTMAWAANATYDSFGPALHADWAAAVAPDGVCAA